MADTPEKEEVKIVKISVEQILPADFLSKLESGEIKSIDEGRKMLYDSQVAIAKNNGYGVVKDAQIGTHNSIKKTIKESLAEVGEELDLPETADTKEHVKAVVDKIKAIKTTPAKDQTVEQKQTLADLEQTRKLLAEAAKKEKELTALLEQKEVEGNAKLENYVKSSYTDIVFEKALANTANSRLPKTSAAAIKAVFKEDFSIDVQLENGAPKGYVIRKKDGSQAQKSANEFYSNLDELLIKLYQDNGFDAQQPAQNIVIGAQPKQGNQNNNFLPKIHVPKGA